MISKIVEDHLKLSKDFSNILRSFANISEIFEGIRIPHTLHPNLENNRKTALKSMFSSALSTSNHKIILLDLE